MASVNTTLEGDKGSLWRGLSDLILLALILFNSLLLGVEIEKDSSLIEV